MLDIKQIRTNPDLFKLGMIKRGIASSKNEHNRQLLLDANIDISNQKNVYDFFLSQYSNVQIEDLNKIEEIDKKRRACLHKVETLKSERNSVSKEIGKRKANNEPADDLLKGMKEASDHIKELEKETSEIDLELDALMLSIPNIPDDSAPLGINETYNKEIRKVGEVTKFNFAPKDHVDIGKNQKILDFDTAAKLTGARFSLLRNQGALLERALINFMLDTHTQKHGYEEVIPPVIVNAKTMQGTGQLPKFAEDLFKLENSDYYLIPTAEVPLTNMFANEILSESDLTINLTAYTPCFRSEAGSYGKDTRGLIRLHQFNKVELLKFTKPENSDNELELLLSHAEEILKQLKLPYRVISLATGDLGFSSAKTYDIEIWVPSQNQYREVSSCSCFKDFQARRANIRFKSNQPNSKPNFVHTINGSGLAIGRTWLAIIENYQDENERIFIPEVLRPYMHNLTHIDNKSL